MTHIKAPTAKAAIVSLFLAVAATLSLTGCKANQVDVPPDSSRGLNTQGEIKPADSGRSMNNSTMDRGTGTAGVGTAGGATR